MDKIREGIEGIVAGYPTCNFPEDKCSKQSSCSSCITNDVLSFLNDNYVVRKVDRELPTTTGLYGEPVPVNGTDDYNRGQIKAQQDMLKWHDDSLRPLIGDGECVHTVIK